MASTLLADNGVSSGAAGLKSSADGTGTLALQTTTASGTATTAVLIDNAQNVGVGVTPSAWRSTEKTLQIGSAAVFQGRSDTLAANIASNWYVTTGGTNTYIATGNASLYQQLVGEHRWFNAASGTAGNAITFTQAMTLDASGKLLVGNTSSISTAGLIQSAASNATTVSNTYLWNSADTGIALKNTSSTTNSAIGLSMFGGAGGNSAAAVLMVQETANSLGALVFYTGGSGRSNTVPEAGRFDSSGNLLVGTTGLPNGTSIYGTALSPASLGRTIIYQATNSTGSAVLQAFYNPNGGVGSISTSGSSTSYATSSDYRLKNFVAPMTGALAKVALLKPCTYKWNVDGEDGEGFIAHELAEVVPHAVIGEKDAFDADGNPVYQGIDTSFLVATLTAAIQEQQALIQSLTDRLTALEGAAK